MYIYDYIYIKCKSICVKFQNSQNELIVIKIRTEADDCRQGRGELVISIEKRSGGASRALGSGRCLGMSGGCAALFTCENSLTVHF